MSMFTLRIQDVRSRPFMPIGSAGALKRPKVGKGGRHGHTRGGDGQELLNEDDRINLCSRNHADREATTGLRILGISKRGSHIL